MTIEIRERGSLFDVLEEDPHAWLTVPVTCQPGVMGAGLAREFAQRWPVLLSKHGEACRGGLLVPGKVHRVHGNASRPGCIFFPTRDDWRQPSRIGWIVDGLSDLALHVSHDGPPETVVLPALGCGLGGLSWKEVSRWIDLTAAVLPEYRWIVYGPDSR